MAHTPNSCALKIALRVGGEAGIVCEEVCHRKRHASETRHEEVDWVLAVRLECADVGDSAGAGAVGLEVAQTTIPAFEYQKYQFQLRVKIIDRTSRASLVDAVDADP